MSSIFPTVAAVSTPRGKGGIAVIRISGDDAIPTAAKMFRPHFGTSYGGDLANAPARVAQYGRILDSDDRPLDEGIATVYRAPHSFTGENMVEISCHGGLAVTEATLLSALAHGAEMAGPGDFTRRAFLNGKLSLTEAEAVGKLIDADTRERMALSASAVRGAVSKELERISADLLTPMTALYAAIDYPEEDVGDEGEKTIGAAISRARDDVKRLLDTYSVGKAVTDGVKTVLCGRPNVGKSSVFNRMTGEDSAIVTELAGTTRDVLRETVSFGGVTLRLSDTAGIREADDAVERIGVDRAERELAGAELILAIFDGSEPLTDEDRRLIALLERQSAPVLSILNKSDRGCALTEAEIGEIDAVSAARIAFSAERDDVKPLSDAVAALYGSDRVDLAADAVIWDVRQKDLLTRSYRALDDAVTALDAGDPIDAVCTLAEEAMAALNETDGRGVDETIVSEIFKRFCVGK